MRNWVLAFVSLLMITCGASPLLAAEIARATTDELLGSDAKLGVNFRASRDLSKRSIAADEVYAIEVNLTHSRRLKASVNYSAQSLEIGFFHTASGLPVRITRRDLETLSRLDRSLPELPGRLGDALQSLVSYIAEAPPNIPIDIKLKPQAGAVESWTSFCGLVGTVQIATYDKLFGKTVHREQRVSQCYEQVAECFGRCGVDCNGTQPSRMQRITKDCLDHDVCTEDLGRYDPDCTDEFYRAADDFFFATDCGAMGGHGSWTGSDSLIWRLRTSDWAKFKGRVVTPNCGTYSVVGRRPGRGRFTLEASTAEPGPGCCSSFLYAGAMDSCTTAAATWTNACDASGSVTMSRKPFPPPPIELSAQKPQDRILVTSVPHRVHVIAPR